MCSNTCGGGSDCPELIGELIGNRKFEFSIEPALFAMVANRACAPSSKLYCHEQWLAEDVRIKGCETLELHHLYRAMDCLEAHKEALEEGLYFRMADLLNLDVEDDQSPSMAYPASKTPWRNDAVLAIRPDAQPLGRGPSGREIASAPPRTGPANGFPPAPRRTPPRRRR